LVVGAKVTKGNDSFPGRPDEKGRSFKSRSRVSTGSRLSFSILIKDIVLLGRHVESSIHFPRSREVFPATYGGGRMAERKFPSFLNRKEKNGEASTNTWG